VVEAEEAVEADLRQEEVELDNQRM